ncbi:uncharacterized protein LOC111347022 isoform X1 [Stylophora pistillata]|uniref:uncharacterized protein LOC111347022 isoform X1 n=1 Tax=Stylophora pistillata TaxID=50429 RepID=UPI000C051E34|nr:uncharacterized protein LOC111347022 isoform X1 [Stylophora pistillata]XP_022810017.1 uncharacterized protein LOC111347022 isoform X1 [Stylophora pistillata]XP_022810018.1 uncharacterized protein LOC111347022 isoform X1 [Stylophora pistillata]
MRDASLRQGVDYAIIFPDESVFKLLSQALEPDMMRVLKHVKSQGRGMITPSHSVVKCSGGNVVVCFSYLQGTDDSSISGLFRAIGAHYCNHFMVIFLPGATRSKDDSFCKQGNLYTVQGAEEFSFKKGKLQTPQHQISFCQGKAQFTAHGFPSCYDWWSRNVMKDPDFSSAASEYRIVPTFDPSKHLKVAFTSASNQDKLRNICIEKREEIGRSIEKRMTKRGIHAVSLDGTLLSKIYRCGRKDNMGILLGVNNTLGPEDPPPMLKQAVDKIIFYLALAFIKADLREVFPSEPDEKDREGIGGELLSSASASSSSSSSSSSEESEEESVEETSGKKRRKRHSHRIKSKQRLRKSRKVIHNFEDDDGNNEEEDEESDSGFGHYEEMRQESQGKRHSAPKQVADPANDPDQCTSNVDSSYKSGKGQKVTDVEEGRQNEDGPEAKKRQGAIPKQGHSPCEKGEESIKLIPSGKKVQ